MQKVDLLVRHLPVVALVAVAVLNILLKDGSIALSDAWADSLNVILGAVGVGAHINNHR